jgi:hypothetical protein
MTTIRELVASLGFQVDTTPADRFNTAIDRTETNLNELNNVNLNKLNRNLKAGLAVATGLITTAVGGGLAAAFKSADVVAAEEQLKFGFKSTFDTLRSEVDKILRDPILGNLATELELLNAAATLRTEGLRPEVITRNLQNILKISTVFREDIAGGTALLLEAIKSGNIEPLIKLGKFNAEQADIIRKSAAGFSQLGIPGRVQVIEDVFREITPALDERINALINRGALSQEQLFNAFDKLGVEIGEKTLPKFKQLTDEGIIPLIDVIRQIISGDIGVESLPGKGIVGAQETLRGAEVSTVAGIIKTFPEAIRTLADFFQFASPNIGRATESLRDINRQNSVTNNFTIDARGAAGNIDFTGLENKLKEVVRSESSRIFGSTAEQSENSTIIRGSGGVR